MTTEVYQKRCCRCKETKLFENFNRNRVIQDGYSRECKTCKTTTQRKYLQRLKDKGIVPFALRKAEYNCCACGIVGTVFMKSVKAKKGCWRCTSCVSKEIQNRPDVKKKASDRARAQLLASGGIKCDDSYKRRSGPDSHSWKGGLPKCVDCRKQLSVRFVSRCLSCSAKLRTGEAHHNWKGGTTPQAVKERNTREASAWRKAIFVRDKFKCQICDQVGGRLQAHHKKKWSDYPELRFEIDNGVTLCRDCHLNTVHQGAWRNEPLDLWA